MAPERRNDLTFLGVIAAIFVLAPFHGVRWGDGLEFTAVASHLGVAHPSGYPLFTGLGKFFLLLPHEEPYRAMLWMCRMASFAAIAGLYFLLKWFMEQSRLPIWMAMIFAGVFAVGIPFWQTLHHVEVYSLNAALLVWIVYLSTREAATRRDLLIAAALQGLAVANHLSSLCALPLLILMLIRKRDVMAIVGGVLLVSVMPLLLYGSLALRVPTEQGHGIGWGSPNTLQSWLSHVRGGEYGQYQFLSFSPGVPFTIETYREFFLHRLLQMLSVIGAMVTGYGPTAAFIGGIVVLVVGIGMLGWKAPFSAKAGLAAAIGLQLVFVYTYNIPDIEDYFLGVMVLEWPFFALGLGMLVRYLLPNEQKQLPVLKLLSGVVLACAMIAMFVGGRPITAGIPGAWRDRLLDNLPDGAGLLTVGDADTYTMWYVQFAQGERLDVAVYGGNFVRFPWFRQTMPPNDPRRETVGFITGPPTSLQEYIANLRRLVIEPMLAHGPLYTTMSQPAELQALEEHYRIELAAPLYSEADWDTVIRSGEVNIAPPYLYEITPR